MIASPAPADAHTYTKEGTVSAREAGKRFKQAFKQRCLTVHEAQHIADGSGYEDLWDEGGTLTFSGTSKSGIASVVLSIDEGDSTYAIAAYTS